MPLVSHALPSAIRTRISETAAKYGVPLRWIYEIDSLGAIKQLVSEGDCHTILPMAAFWQEVAAGRLAAARIVDPHVFLPLTLASSRSGVVSLPAKKLISIIRDVIQSSVDSGAWSGKLVPPRRERRHMPPCEGIPEETSL